MDFQESNLARLLLAAGLPNQMHSRLGSGSSSSPCTPAMQRAHLSHVRINSFITSHMYTVYFELIVSCSNLLCNIYYFISFKIYKTYTYRTFFLIPLQSRMFFSHRPVLILYTLSFLSLLLKNTISESFLEV